MFDLKGKVAVVTGASRGVGRGIALGLLEAGATVHITGRTQVDGTHPLDRPGGSTRSSPMRPPCPAAALRIASIMPTTTRSRAFCAT